jgi:hypothetical protein
MAEFFDALPVDNKRFLLIIISHCENNDGRYPEDDNALLIGLCTGAIAAAAVGCCSSLSELVPAALYAVNVSFYTGCQAANAGDALTGPTSSSSSISWALIAHGLSESSATRLLQTFSESSVS